MPQAKLAVKDVVEMLVEKHGTFRHNMGSIAKKRPNTKKVKVVAPLKLDAEGNPIPKRVVPDVPTMFTREAARSMA